MNTDARARGRGTAFAQYRIVGYAARARCLPALRLEASSHKDVELARRLHETHGSRQCAPFDRFQFDPNGTFQTKAVP